MRRAILVKSCQKNRERQDAIKATWANALYDASVPVIPVESGHSIVMYSGRLQLVGGDDYSDNSIKVRWAIRWLTNFDDWTNLFICDDDTFIHPQRWLAHEPEGEFECRLYHPVTDADVKRNQGRPWACGGAGWYMSRRLCELYVEEVTARCSWDDILATQVAQRYGVEIVDRPDLYGCSKYGGGQGSITCHPVEPVEMREMWDGAKEMQAY